MQTTIHPSTSRPGTSPTGTTASPSPAPRASASATAPIPRSLPLEPARALRAFVALAKDPDDLPQVFTILQAMSGSAPLRLLKRFRATASGSALLEARTDIVELLADREALRALPDGTLGRAYLDFVESEGISAEGIRDAAARGEDPSVTRPSDLDYLHARMRDTHDLWHAATGYRGDVLGEAALLAFILAQTWNGGVGIIVALGLYKAQSPEARALILDGFLRGRRAAWLPPQPWEELLALPLSVVRERLRLPEAPVYTPIRTSELRAQGLLLRPRARTRTRTAAPTADADVTTRDARRCAARGDR